MTDHKWDYRFLSLAQHVSSWSKDPSSQVGAVVADCDRRVVSVGYNGFARGVIDAEERYADRDVKYSLVVHAEINALLFANRNSLSGCTLYTWPFSPCARCAAIIIQTGIRRCVAPPLPAKLQERWAESVNLARQQFDEAGVELCILSGDVKDDFLAV